MQLKPGRTADDAKAIADLIWETDPEMCQFVFGNKQIWQQCCEIEWLAECGLHSHRSAIVACVDTSIVGVAIAYPQSELANRYSKTVSRYTENIGQRMETVGWLFPVLPEQSSYVFNLAVDPAFRGQGIGRQLLSHIEQQAQANGLSSIHLDVATPTPAVGFYESSGYTKLVETSLITPMTEIPSHYRMCKELLN